jgi:multiple sugar transport system permease protein
MTATLDRVEVDQVTSAPNPRRRWRGGWIVTGITGLVLFVFLLPLGYMAITSLKSEQMIADLDGPILPKSAATFEYEGEQLEIYTVPMPDGTTRELAMLQPGRQTSQFIDPSDPSAGPIEWEGNWRLLEPAYALDPQWQNYGQAWELMDFPVLLRNTLVIAGLGTIGAVGSSILVAYGLARFHVPFGRSIMVVLIATIILPRYATLVPT